jgi:hypothetical protein
MYTIVSTRFNNTTWKENQNYRLKKNVCCIYGSPQEMSPKIDYDSIVFVVEMNNSTNKIEGIGLIKNHPYSDKYYKIYSDGNFNRYIYKGKYYIDRETLLRNYQHLVEILDYILFKEKTHLKRGSGFTTIPEKLLKHKMCENINIKKEIRDLFILKYRNISSSYSDEKMICSDSKNINIDIDIDNLHIDKVT